MSEAVIITEVGPRDGLQNQSRILSFQARLKMIQALRAAGLTNIEVGAFVSPKAVPAMADTDQIISGLAGVAGKFSVLIPNMKGYELAVSAGAKTVTMVVYGTEGMAQANVNRSREQVGQATLQMIKRAADDGVKVITTIAVAFECPFDGPVSAVTVLNLAADLLQQGADEVVIADTIGAANPAQVRALTRELVSQNGPQRLGCHFHDTRAMGLANVYAALESGIRKFDASVGGLGGCPFAPGASGNVATDDVVMMLEQMGFVTGVDQRKLAEASALAAELTGNTPGGRAHAWLNRQLNAA